MTEAAYKRIALIFPMLSASNEGEVLNAARAMTKVLKDHDLHWNDVANRIRNGAGKDPPKEHFARAKPPPPHAEGPRRQKSAWALDKEDVERALTAANASRGLDDWSEVFLQSIYDQVLHQGRTLTERQRDKLNEIMDKLGL